MSLTLKLETPHARIFPAARKSSNEATTCERLSSGFLQCSRYKSRKSVPRRSRLVLQARAI